METIPPIVITHITIAQATSNKRSQPLFTNYTFIGNGHQHCLLYATSRIIVQFVDIHIYIYMLMSAQVHLPSHLPHIHLCPWFNFLLCPYSMGSMQSKKLVSITGFTLSRTTSQPIFKRGTVQGIIYIYIYIYKNG